MTGNARARRSPASGACAEPGNHEGVTKADVADITQPQFSPYAGRNFPTPVSVRRHPPAHRGLGRCRHDVHRVGQEDAFRFARGEEITTTHGLRAKLARPLDFLVITDHAEMYGLMPHAQAATRRFSPPKGQGVV